MSISLPTEPVYYFECYNGEFRLTYFIPIRKLRDLVKKGHANESILKDFPIGVDIDCYEQEFNDFKKTYSLKLPYSPEDMADAFFAIFTSTKNWKNFIGTGYLRAIDVERHIKEVSRGIKDLDIIEERITPPSDKPSYKQMKSNTKRSINASRKKMQYLKKFTPDEWVENDKQINEQNFPNIKMEKGKGKENREEFFNRILKNKSHGK